MQHQHFDAVTIVLKQNDGCSRNRWFNFTPGRIAVHVVSMLTVAHAVRPICKAANVASWCLTYPVKSGKAPAVFAILGQ